MTFHNRINRSALIAASMLVIAGCTAVGPESPDKETTVLNTRSLDEIHAELRALVDGMANKLPGKLGMIRDVKLSCQRIGSKDVGNSYRWEYDGHLPASPEAIQTAKETILPVFQKGGWKLELMREGGREENYRMTRTDGTMLSIGWLRDGTGDIVIGGTSICVPE